jgi:hypothetical protein
LFHLVLESHDGRALGADSEEKHEPVSDIDTVVVDSLKVLDPERPIREADMGTGRYQVQILGLERKDTRLVRMRGDADVRLLRRTSPVRIDGPQNYVRAGRERCLSGHIVHMAPSLPPSYSLTAPVIAET